MSDISNTNEIEMFIHCAACLSEKPDNTSPREWASLEVGWTKLGFQVWCKRHDANVMHVDFQGAKHPANITANIAKMTAEEHRLALEEIERLWDALPGTPEGERLNSLVDAVMQYEDIEPA